MTIYLIVGLPGAGKTKRAKELEVSGSALRLTPDDWQMAVFDDDSPTQWRSAARAAQRDRIEGKLVEVGMRVARLGMNVVFDFGLWEKMSAQRSVRSRTRSVSAPRSSTYRLTTTSSADASPTGARPRRVSFR